MGEPPCSAPTGMLSHVIPGSPVWNPALQTQSGASPVCPQGLVLISGSTPAAEGQENPCATAGDAGSQHIPNKSRI